MEMCGGYGLKLLDFMVEMSYKHILTDGMVIAPESRGASGVLYFPFDFTLPLLLVLTVIFFRDSSSLGSVIPNIFAFVLGFLLE